MVNGLSAVKALWRGQAPSDAKPSAVLHYYFDPLCGWCYAAAPLIHAAANMNELTVQLHAGGMMSGEKRQSVTPALRQYVIPHDQRIQAVTGQPFGEAYFEGLLRDENAVFDSTPPSLAILAAAALNGEVGVGRSGLAMLARLQQAHYVEGLRIADGTVLLKLALELGYESAEFAQAMSVQSQTIQAHFTATRRAMSEQRLRGFPSLVLEQAGQLRPLEVSPYLGQAEQFVAALRASFAPASALASAATFPLCTPDGCA